MTTVVPKLSKPDVLPFKAPQPAHAGENRSASFARALKEADASKTAVRQASGVTESSVRLRGQTGESGASAGSAEGGDDSVVNDNGSVRSVDLDSAAKKSSDSSAAPAADSANVAGIAPPLVSIAGTSAAPSAIAPADDARTTEVANLSVSGAMAKAVELAQAAALWDNGGLKDESAGSAPAKSGHSTLANVLSTDQGSTISGVMDPAMFAASGGGVGSAASLDSATVGTPGVWVASTSISSGFAGGPIGFSGASAALQGAVRGASQDTATSALLNAGRLEASLSGVGSPGLRAASSANSGAVSVASALAAASTVRATQSSALSDAVGLSATAGSITGTLSVPVMSGSAGADLGGSTLGSQTGGAGSESGASSGGSRSGSSNAFTVQAIVPSEPNVTAALSGAAEASARSFRSVGMGSDSTASSNSTETTNAARVAEVPANQSPTLDVNAPAAQASASVAADPRAAWRDLRSKWDQPIRANAPKA